MTIDRVRYHFGRAGGLESAGLALPTTAGRVIVRGTGPTRAEALAAALDKVDGVLLGEVGAEAKPSISDLESRYGNEIRQYGKMIGDGIRAGKALTDSGASSAEVLDGISSGMAAIGAALALIPGVGWIAGAVTEIAAAILAGINALLAAYPARALDPYEAGINLALRRLGYSTQTGDPFTLDGDALMAASRDGWIFYSRQRTSDEGWDTLIKRFPIDVACLLSVNFGTLPHYRISRAECTRDLNEGKDATSINCTLLADIPTKGRQRFAATVGKLGVRGMDYPTVEGKEKESGVILGHWDLEGGVRAAGFGVKIDTLPPDMQRAIRAAFLAPRDEWPDDRGVCFALSKIQPPESATQEDRNVSGQLLTFMGKWIDGEEGTQLKPNAGRTRSALGAAKIRDAAKREPQIVKYAPPLQPRPQPADGGGWDGAWQGGGGTAPAIGLSSTLAERLDGVRELAELARAGDVARVRRLAREGGPLGRLARKLLKA